MKLRRIVARNLRRIRQERGLSQEELADRAGLNRNYIGMIEREENAPTIDAIEQLSAALNVDPVTFFEGARRGSDKT
jgi:transcriptional regulator with XRE-family HTH domain